ncbi:MAG: hypothetical protein RIR00_1019 [Pseudomonadota bacterium]|jgi:hypothetical protein
MNVLILDPDFRRRKHLQEALSWFDQHCAVFEAANQGEADHWLRHNPFGIVLIGPELEMGTVLTVVYLRRRLPGAYLVVCDNQFLHRGVSPGHLEAAGSNLIVDQRMSPWKIAVLLRPLLSVTGSPIPVAENCMVMSA